MEVLYAVAFQIEGLKTKPPLQLSVFVHYSSLSLLLLEALFISAMLGGVLCVSACME
jgi:hypothetical protein